jgi:oligoribonuclease NrnB/cAMP/cGMP phosphodiesterase (DHH superfamily)
MEALANWVDKFIWIDHHASSISAYELLQKEKGIGWGYDGVRIDGFCGAELTWAWFSANRGNLLQSLSSLPTLCAEAPDALKLVGDWDTWRHKNIVDSKAPFFKTYFDTMVPEGIIEWFYHYTLDTLRSNSDYTTTVNVDEAVRVGTSIKMYEVSESSALMKSRAFDAELTVPYPASIHGRHVYSVIAANFGARGSDRFASVYDHEKHQIMLGFAYENTGKVTVSLYSIDPDIDCGDIAKRCGELGPFPGGGGHKGAAGFQTSWEFLMEKLLCRL